MYDYYPKLYLRTKGNVELSSEEYPLSFATHYEENAAFQKRKSTVDSWATSRGYGKKENAQSFGPFFIDNVPVSGFKFDKDVSRWSTSNKWFRIQDPRGFTLEISSDNLTDLIHNGELKNGEIIGNYVWVRDKQTNYLLREDNEKLVMVVGGHTGIKVGDVVSLANIERATYAGVYFSTNEIDYSYSQRGANNRYKDERELWLYDRPKSISKFNVFVYFDKGGTQRLYLVKSMPKYRIVLHDPDFDRSTLLNKGLFDAPSSGFKGLEFYDTKEDAKAAPKVTADQVKKLIEVYHDWYPTRYNVYYNDQILIAGYKENT